MTGLDVYSLVTAKRQRLEELIDPACFVLNPEVEKLQKEIAALQEKCPHDYVEGVCRHCGKEQ
jgi:hypothetical protein